MTCMDLAVTLKKIKDKEEKRTEANLERLNRPHHSGEHFIKGSILLEWVDLNSQIKKPSLQVIVYRYLYREKNNKLFSGRE